MKSPKHNSNTPLNPIAPFTKASEIILHAQDEMANSPQGYIDPMQVEITPKEVPPKAHGVQFQENPLEGTPVQIERLLFEHLVKPGETPDIQTKALLIIGKLIHVDPSRKVLPYKIQDEESCPKLAQHYHIPEEMETLPAYIAQPAYNSKLNKIIFYTRFKTTTSISSLKQDPNYLGWLKENKVFIRSMNIESTENV